MSYHAGMNDSERTSIQDMWISGRKHVVRLLWQIPYIRMDFFLLLNCGHACQRQKITKRTAIRALQEKIISTYDSIGLRNNRFRDGHRQGKRSLRRSHSSPKIRRRILPGNWSGGQRWSAIRLCTVLPFRRLHSVAASDFHRVGDYGGVT